MKRSPLKRTTPLARGSKAMNRGAPMARNARLRKVGKRGRAISKALKAARLVVEERDGNLCARCSDPRCLPLELHHVVGRGRGGSHEPSNLKLLGARCHSAVSDRTAPDSDRWVKSNHGTRARALSASHR